MFYFGKFQNIQRPCSNKLICEKKLITVNPQTTTTKKSQHLACGCFIITKTITGSLAHTLAIFYKRKLKRQISIFSLHL